MGRLAVSAAPGFVKMERSSLKYNRAEASLASWT
jgi:hypothetical protein